MLFGAGEAVFARSAKRLPLPCGLTGGVHCGQPGRHLMTTAALQPWTRGEIGRGNERLSLRQLRQRLLLLLLLLLLPAVLPVPVPAAAPAAAAAAATRASERVRARPSRCWALTCPQSQG